MEFYDAIIIGAGPAGLLLGKELSKKHKILILEKNKIGVTNKCWATYKDRWLKEKFPIRFIENEFKEWFIQMKYGGKITNFFIKDNFICFNEHKFLSWLASVCQKQNAIIHEKEKFSSFKRHNNLIIVNKKYYTKLLIDCAGIDSPIVKKYKLVELPIYINCYAYIGEFDKVKNKNFYYVCRNNSRLYSSFGFTKIAPRLALLLYFKYSNNKPNFDKYKEEMRQVQRIFGIKKHKIKELKIATYPTGVLKKRELDNIILFGDSGFYSPSVNGMGFNEILRQHKRVAKHISKCIKEEKYSERDLKIPKDIADDIDNLFFRLLGLIINEIPPSILYQMFQLLNKKLSMEEKKRLMRNDITDKEGIHIFKLFIKHINMEKLIKNIKKHHAKYIIKTIFELNKDILTEEIHNLFFKHHKIRIKDMYR